MIQVKPPHLSHHLCIQLSILSPCFRILFLLKKRQRWNS